MSATRKLGTLGLTVFLSLALASVALAQATPSVTVSDQPITDGTVTVDSVVSDGPGWIVIHAQQDGSPGPVIGQAAVSDGENTDVAVEIDVSQATDTLYAMLHADDGVEGTYEFPDGDPPVQVEGQVVVVPFAATDVAEDGAEAEDEEPTLLPETGGDAFPWGIAIVVVGGALLLAAGALLSLSLSPQGARTKEE